MLRLAAELLGGIASPLQWTEENFVHDASQKDQRKTCNRLPPHCRHTLLQGVCLHDPCMGGGGLERFQAKIRHGFCSGQNVLTTNLILDECKAATLPLWIISFDLSNTLGNYTKSGNVLKRFAYTKYFRPIDLHTRCNACSTIKQVDSRTFDMPAGVRQGCALRLAMSKWRFANPQGGIGLGDRVRRLLDLRCSG